MKRGLAAVGLLAATGCSASAPTLPAGFTADPAPVRAQVPGLIRTVELTTHTADDYHPELSTDGRRLLFVSNRSGQPDLWLKSLEGGSTRGAVRVTWHTAIDTDPAWSPDGDAIAFTSHREDPDGDIYTVEAIPLLGAIVSDRLLWRRGSILKRHTRSDRADREAVYHPDGRRLIYTSRPKGRSRDNLRLLYLDGDEEAHDLTAEGGHAPDISPDGRSVVFAAARGADGTDHDLFVLRLEDGAELRLTEGRGLDAQPAWSGDGTQVVFTRFDQDTDGDGRITPSDRGSLYRIDIGEMDLASLPADANPALPTAVPLTAPDADDLFPTIFGERVIFATDRQGDGRGPLDIAVLPLAGLVEERADSTAQAALAEALSSRDTLPVETRILAYRKVLRPFVEPPLEVLRERAQQRVGELHFTAGEREDARRSFEALIASAPDTSSTRALAEIEILRITRLEAEDRFRSEAERHRLEQILETGIERLDRVAERFQQNPMVAVRVHLEQGRHELTRRQRLAALEAFRAAEQRAASFGPQLGAEAAFERGRVYEAVGDRDGLIGSDLNLLDRYGDERPFAGYAADRVVATMLGDPMVLDEASRLAALRQVVDRHASPAVLPARALLELGRRHEQRGEPDRAEAAYQRVVSDFSSASPELSRARLALADLYHATGRDDAALEAYLSLQHDLPEAERAYGIARASYIRRSLERGRRALSGNDPEQAVAIFVTLIKYDEDIVEAHRGLIEAYAATGRAREIEAHYEARVDEQPSSAIAHYALGLARTYRTPVDFATAEQAVRTAIALDARLSFAHQTLGFLLDQRATGVGPSTRAGRALLDGARDAYLTAMALTVADEHAGRRADLALNLGNVMFRLANYRRALESYRERAEADQAFTAPAQEAVFRMQYGESAQKMGSLEEAEEQLAVALTLWTELERPEFRYQVVDLLGLVHQQMGRHLEAVEDYRQALSLSRRLGDSENSRLAMRNIAVNLTFAAEPGTGVVDWRLLEEALASHRESLAALEQGAEFTTRDEGTSSGGLSVRRLDIALTGDASRAAFGFDAEGERQLALSFIARIYREAGHAEAAIGALERKRARLRSVPKGADASFALTERAILTHQLGLLYREVGDLTTAFERFRSSLRLCLRLASTDVAVPGASLNLDYLALLARESDTASIATEDLDAVLERARAFVAKLDVDRQAEARARMLNGLAVLNRAIALRENEPQNVATAVAPARAVRASLTELSTATARLDRSRELLREGITALGSPQATEGIRRRRLRAALTLNLAKLLEGRSAGETRSDFERTRRSLIPGIDDDLRWQMAVALATPELTPEPAERAALRSEARALLEQAPPGLMPAADPARLLELYGAIAVSARERGDLAGMLEALDWVPALRMRAALATSALAGSFPLTESARQTGSRWSAYWGAVEELRQARRGDAGRDGAAALARILLARGVPADLSGTLGTLFEVRPADVSDAQARLPEGSVLVVAAMLPGEHTMTLARLTPAAFELASDVAEATAGARSIYLSPRGALEAPSFAAEAIGARPSATVFSLAHLSTALDGRTVLRSGHLVVTDSVPPSASDDPPTGRTVLSGVLADRLRIRNALPQHPVVEMAVPWTGGSDVLGTRWLAPGSESTIRPFTLADTLELADRHRVMLLDSIALPAGVRDVAVELLGLAGFPSVVIAETASTRAAIIAELEFESVGQAAAGTDARVYGAIGFDADEAIAFAEESYERVLGKAASAYQSENWTGAADGFAEALSLEAVLDLPGDRQRILFHLTEASARALQFERAVRFQAQAVALSEARGDLPALAENLYYLGVFRSRAERYEQAEAALIRSAQLYEELGQADRASQALATRGIAQENAGRYGDALSSFTAALDLDRSVGNPEREGRELRRIGRIQLVRLNHYAQAEASFRHAQEVLADAGDIEGWLEATLEIGLAREAVGDLPGAIALYEEGMDAALEFEAPEQFGKATLYRAQAHWLVGDYTRAFEDVRRSAEIAGDLGSERLTYLTRNLTILIRWSLNDHDRALDAADEAMALARALGDPAERATVHNNRGIVLRDSGRAAAALEELGRALAIDRERGSRWGEGYDLRNLGMTYLDLGRLEEARSKLERAREVSHSIGDRVNEAKAVVSLGDTLLELGETVDALDTFEAARDLGARLGVLEVVWRAEWGAGRAQAALERGDEALASLMAAVQTVESMRASLALEEMRNGFITNKVDLYEDVILELLERGETVRAFEYAERSRARGFIDLLGNARIRPASERSRELLGRVQTVEQRINAARSLENLEQRERTVLRLDAERRDLLAEVQLTDPELTSFVSVAPLDAAEIRGLLDDDTALLAYFVAAHEVIIWTVQPEALTVTRVAIERSDLEQRITEFRDRIQAIEPLEREARALYELLVRPALEGVPEGATLGMVPHGRLHYLSFAALSDGEAYLVERHPLFYTPSASVLSYVRSKTRKPPGRLRVLAIGNPDLGSRDFDLPFAEKEVQSLRWTYPQIDILTGAEATEDWLLENAAKYDVIHLASHGEFDSVNPLASALKLARGSSGGNGDLTAEDVFGLRLNAELVTLSACQTGLGRIEAGDEVIGMNRAFLYAGTPSLLSTLWRVSDVSTAVLIKHFYRGYDGRSRAEALRRAQLHVMSYYPHPSYWAGFTLTGDHR